MEFFVTESLGESRSRTPEGYLVCLDVPLARTGELLYGPREVPIEPGPDGVIHIQRSAEEVFHPDTLASINGKTVTDDHPEGMVDADNWRKLMRGVAINARRGAGALSDHQVADLVIYDSDLAEAINSKKKRQISLGYDAQYIQIRPGLGYQKDIRVNHIAVVDDGRCGVTCAVGDSSSYSKRRSSKMKITMDRVNEIINSIFKDAELRAREAVAKATADGEFGGEGAAANIHIHHNAEGFAKDHEERIKGLEEWKDSHTRDCTMASMATDKKMKDKKTRDEDTVEEEKKKEDQDEEKEEAKDKRSKDKKTKDETEQENKEDKTEAVRDEDMEEEEEEGAIGDKSTKDSRHFAATFQSTVALAEILSPGIKLPTFDARAAKTATYSSICDLRKRALIAGTKDTATKEIINGIHGRALDTARINRMTCTEAKALFNAAATVKQARTSDGAGARVAPNVGYVDATSTSLADVNKRNADFWSARRR